MTFAREGMALVGLLIVGMNTLLISLDVLSSYRRLGRLGRLLRVKSGKVRLWQGKLEGYLPSLRLSQVGYSRGEGKVILQERERTSTLGGTVQLGPEGLGGELSLPGTAPMRLDAPDESLWVWPSEANLKRAFACPEPRTFEDLELRARAARGVEREVVLSLASDESAYVLGRLTAEGNLVPVEVALGRAEKARAVLLVAGADPRKWVRAQRFRLGLSLLGIALVFALLVGVCFVPPAFGAISQAGALGLLLFFLLVQPFGVYLGEASRMPHEAIRSAVWKPSPKASGEPLRVGSAR